jgi:hypothetical protein
LVPTLLPFTFHWNEGEVPPFTGVAEKVTLFPAQMGLADAEMLTLAGKTGFTVITMAFEVAGFPDTQGAFEVITQVTIWPLVNELDVYAGLLAPTLLPFTFHW